MPRLLDLFCGAGGCSVGYARAGWEVVGWDWIHHDAYPDSTMALTGHFLDVDCQFVQGDAMTALHDLDYLNTFDAVHTSPPCPYYSAITPEASRSDHPDLIPVVRDLLRAWGGPYVIENVEGAAPSMKNPVKLCGSSFGLAVRRHRLFESNLPLHGLPCTHDLQGVPVGVYGAHPEVTFTPVRPANGKSRGQRARTVRQASEAMGIDWMPWEDLTDAIPPSYTQFLGAQLLTAVGVDA